MTNQDTTFTNQDEAFNKYWHIEMLTQSLPSGADKVAERAYQAATKASQSEINSLKEQVRELQSHLSSQSIEIAHNHVTLESCAHKVTELQAHVNQLREALESFEIHDDVGLQDLWITHKYPAEIDDALNSITAQSLAQHDNEVIERCAKEIDKMVNVYTKNCDKYKIIGSELDVERNVNKGRAAMSCAEVIRALKVTP